MTIKKERHEAVPYNNVIVGGLAIAGRVLAYAT